MSRHRVEALCAAVFLDAVSKQFVGDAERESLEQHRNIGRESVDGGPQLGNEVYEAPGQAVEVGCVHVPMAKGGEDNSRGISEGIGRSQQMGDVAIQSSIQALHENGIEGGVNGADREVIDGHVEEFRGVFPSGEPALNVGHVIVQGAEDGIDAVLLQSREVAAVGEHQTVGVEDNTLDLLPLEEREGREEVGPDGWFTAHQAAGVEAETGGEGGQGSCLLGGGPEEAFAVQSAVDAVLVAAVSDIDLENGGETAYPRAQRFWGNDGLTQEQDVQVGAESHLLNGKRLGRVWGF